jgi:hypothetical protein
MSRTTSSVVRWCAILATAVQGVLLVGFVFFVLAILRTFREITASGEPNPQLMAQGVGEALIPIVLAAALSVWGILASVLIATVSRYRAKWFYRLSLVSAVLHVLAFPFGTAFGLAFLVLLLVKRAEFRAPAGASPLAS